MDKPTPPFTRPIQLPHSARKRRRSDERELEISVYKPRTEEKMEYISITHIRVTNVVTRLRRIPIGFYAEVKNGNLTKRTRNKQVSVGKNVVEWDDVIVLPFAQSSSISLTVIASFGLGPTLGSGEALLTFEFTLSELLDRNGQFKSMESSDTSDGEDLNSSLKIDIERRASLLDEDVVDTDPPESDKTRKLRELTERGQRALVQYRELEKEEYLNESIEQLELACESCPPDFSYRDVILFNLATAKLMHCRVNDTSPDLDVPIELYRTVLGLRSRAHLDYPFTLLSLGIAFQARFQRQGDESDETNGKDLLSKVLGVAQADSYAYHVAILALGSTARREMIPLTRDHGSMEDDPDDETEGEVQRLDASLQWIFFPDSSQHYGLLDHLGILFCIRLQHLGELSGLENQISILEVVVKFGSDDHCDKPSWLNDLAVSLLTRYQNSSNITDLEKSVSMNEEAVRLAIQDDEHCDKSLFLSDLSNSLSARYERFGYASDLEKSISMKDCAVRLTADNDPEKSVLLNKLGELLLSRYRSSGKISDINRSISAREDAVRLTPDDHPNKAIQLTNLGNSLLARYNRSGDMDDLRRLIKMQEDAVELTPEDHPSRPLLLNNLGNSLLTRYECSGGDDELERLISLLKNAVELTPNDDPDKPARLNNLANALATRYQCFGDIDDLDQLMLMRKLAVDLTLDGHRDRPLLLNNFGNALSTRYERFRDVKDLEESIRMIKEAVGLTSDSHPYRAGWLSDLGSSFLIRFEHSRDVSGLRESVSMYDGAVKLTHKSNPDKPGMLNNLGKSWLARYDHPGDDDATAKSTSINEAILANEEAVQLTADGHPDKPLWLTSLAYSLLKRSQHSDNLASLDLSHAVQYSSQAARSCTGTSTSRFEASRVWIQSVRRLQHESQDPLLEAYAAAIELLPRISWMGLSLHDRHHQLLKAANIARDAAAAALEAKRPELAIEWLEQGRSVVWSQLSQLRSPVDDLRDVYPELANQFQDVSHQLDNATARKRAKANLNEIANHPNTDDELSQKLTQYHALALSRERLLSHIRALPGFKLFMLPKTIDHLSPLASLGPVIFLNASKYRCDALVIKSTKCVVHVPLLDTSYDGVARIQIQLKKLLSASGRLVPRQGDPVPQACPSNDDWFRWILAYLWDKVVSPILNVLALPQAPSGSKLPRVFWCPTGPFSFLPIHAAGRYGSVNPGQKLSDFVVSSYIPAMNALELSPQENPEAHVRLLAVRQPSTDGHIPLGGVKPEIDAIRKLASSSSFVDFEEADGTVEDVLKKVKDSNWAHFACHGTQDREDPLDSGLLLANRRRLKVSDIIRLSRPRSGLAFLSACQTATGDEKLSEEAIHIAAGMLLAGYSGVIATMWSIMDRDAPKVAEEVYKILFRDGKVPDSREAAEALHHAIGRLRGTGTPFLSWVPFIHVGV